MWDQKVDSNVKECRRCGNCCRNGPPALHKADYELYAQGFLQKHHLLTLRKGEWVFENVQGAFIRLSEEMVRLRAKKENRSCIFFNEEENSCTIYRHRPLECRVMKCWDTREIEKIYNKDRLVRLDLISSNSALGEIITEHERQCSLERIGILIEQIKAEEDKDASFELAQLIKIDEGWRKALQDNAGADNDTLNFILGRELQKILPLFGLEVIRVQGSYRFIKKRLIHKNNKIY